MLINTPVAVADHPLSVRYVSEDPFILSCDSAHIPPYLVQWWRGGNILSDGDSFSFSSRLIHRRNSTFGNTLTIAQRSSSSTYRCTISVIVQPYFSYIGNKKDRVTRTCEFLP